MGNDKIIDLGRVEAISNLYKESGYGDSGATYQSGGKNYSEINAVRVFTEGVNFDLTYFPLKHLGYKCATGVFGELYARLARPRTLSVVFSVSARFGFDQISELWQGFISACREHGIAAVKVDLVPSNYGLSITASASGEVSELTEKRRSKAQSKDLVCVSGNLGAAYMGMRVLEKEKAAFQKTSASAFSPGLDQYKMLVGAYLKPALNPGIVSSLEEAEIIPSYGYFITDGLSDAVKRLKKDSGFGVKIYADKIPFAGNTFGLGKELDIDPVSAAMNGGDDFRLMFVIPILKLEKFRRDFQTFDIIGHLALPETGAVLVTPDGAELPMKSQGWND